MKLNNIHILSVLTTVLFFFLIFSCNKPNKEQVWPPELPTADENGVATLSGPDLLQVPSSVQHILDSAGIRLDIAKTAPKIELVYHNDLPSASFNGTGWSSWGNICIASDGKVYTGIGNHGGVVNGEALLYCWDPSSRTLKKIADINEVTGANTEEVHFSKIHAHIIEGKDRKIYFVGTLDDGGKAGSSPILEKWDEKIAGGKIFQYDPQTGNTIVYADFPKARVASKLKYDKERNILYCPIEGHSAYKDGFALGAFDMDKKEWIYIGTPGQLRSINIMLDARRNLFYQGKESFAHMDTRLKTMMEIWRGEEVNVVNKDHSIIEPELFKAHKRLENEEVKYTTLWKYDPTTKTVSPTDSYFKGDKFSDPTEESDDGLIYGTTEKGKLFRYSPSRDQLDLLGSNFLVKGETITASVLSPDEKYIYYMPGAHGSAGLSGTPVIQYNIEKEQQKALAFLYEPMNKAFNYAPGGTYGLKISNDGSTLYVSLNGAPSDSLRPEGLGRGFGLCSFAIIHIPASERNL